MPTVDFYGDEDFVDGFIEKSGTTWSTVHDATTGDAATVDTDGTNGQVQTFIYLGTTYYIRRGFYSWDTSSIGAGSTITAASFFIKLSSHSGAPLMNVVQGSQAAADALTTSDFDAFGTTKFSTDASNTTDGTYQEFVLNASGIAAIQKTGTTKFVLTRDKDIDNSAPSDFVYANYYGSRNATPSNRPYLRVTYSSAATVVTPSALATTAAVLAPTVVISDTTSPSAQALTVTVLAPSLKTDDSFAPSAQALTLTIQTPTVLGGKIVTPSALALTTAIPAPTVMRDRTVSVSALSLTSALLSTSYVLGTTVMPSPLALSLTVQAPENRWNNRSKATTVWTIRGLV